MKNGASAPAPLRVALGEYDIGWHDPDASLDRAARLTDQAAAAGARLVVLPEMCTSGFTMDVERFAEPPDGERVSRLSRMARAAGVWLVAGVPIRDADADIPTARNAALAFTPAGALASAYYKQRLFGFADENRSYRAGVEPVVVDIEGVRVSPFICYDLRFPELFRSVAAQSDLMLVIASWPAERRTHWDALLPARAIENQCYVIGVNRTGIGGSIAYDGGSAAYDPWGAVLPRSVAAGDAGVSTVAVSPLEVTRVRASYPFLADFRPA